eukprot:CAMPEP_0113434992 /NCGR_PEP_ID=MMETSP0013_2-20120614/35993_1 /TAXON_ID=2843 ORGANISM="Skeletonema costatum, Strain 1716" /NCGR_SAMPLE_ID=MMETSP0013_2 /ASSEMBLY_ACC=CAM_ASM_000158 /LENGTH=244 /DNA_ID=CAMNT_0000325247 /DNA_START=186 /DNA_END=920 /DNA_ORIENTATION=+ /assembly_acc=CAM_ASM_000158
MSMNIFRLCGDMCHVFSIIVLLLRLRVARNAQGISLRTHELFLLVFLTRYTDLFTTFYSLYNSVMKVLYIASTSSIVYAIRLQEPICSTYDRAQDTFRHWAFAVAPCAVLALLTHLISGGHFSASHELFLLVFLTRYTDLFTTFYSLYNSVMKVLYIASPSSIVYAIRLQEPICSTYDRAQDTFRHWAFAVAPCAVLALLTHLISGGVTFQLRGHSGDVVDIQHLPRKYCNPATIDCVATFPRG